MPKARRDNSVSYERSRQSPIPSSSNHARQSTPNFLGNKEDVKEWEEARCPVCMEHPHNAVLLICSSYEKGCHPYMCDTSYRHSNCLDQYCKSVTEASLSAPTQTLDLAQSSTGLTFGSILNGSQDRRNQDHLSNPDFSAMHKLQHNLVCPLCRGQISGWIVVDSARCFMNAKLRSCACETCDFSGNYTDLRKHARHEHPLVRPSEADPERQRNWRRLERQRDIGDVLSTIQSTFGDDRDDDGLFDDRSWLTVFLLIRVIRPAARSRSSSWSGTPRMRAQAGSRRRSIRLWGESFDAEIGSRSRDENHESSDGSSDAQRQRTRRRTTPDEQM
ncbi:hypothetical protein Nepgr_032542 [Nepenthes gracilis]|uniref:Uncharacterized protein n=1 Tax=Nepenthes gracilis TaxID=150966 RepID=A0AAD3TK69_NEPGR|nr:hypothetical protein Nepgr_032542 [Nepenthes gracilis]